MSPEEHSEFWRKVQFTVDKDVVRTDRSNHFFRGENNPNVEIMRLDHLSLIFPISFSLNLYLSIFSTLSFFHLLSIHPYHSYSSAQRTGVPIHFIF